MHRTDLAVGRTIGTVTVTESTELDPSQWETDNSNETVTWCAGSIPTVGIDFGNSYCDFVHSNGVQHNKNMALECGLCYGCICVQLFRSRVGDATEVSARLGWPFVGCLVVTYFTTDWSLLCSALSPAWRMHGAVTVTKNPVLMITVFPLESICPMCPWMDWACGHSKSSQSPQSTIHHNRLVIGYLWGVFAWGHGTVQVLKVLCTWGRPIGVRIVGQSKTTHSGLYISFTVWVLSQTWWHLNAPTSKTADTLVRVLVAALL